MSMLRLSAAQLIDLKGMQVAVSNTESLIIKLGPFWTVFTVKREAFYVVFTLEDSPAHGPGKYLDGRTCPVDGVSDGPELCPE